MFKNAVSVLNSIIKRFITYTVLIVIVLIGLSFALLNSEIVSFNYYFGKQDLQLSLLLVLVLVLGALLGVAASFGMLFRTRREISRVRKAVKSKDKEIKHIQASIIKDEP